MRRALLTALVATGACAAPAAADTVAHRTPAIGPKIAGAETVWGEETRAGGARRLATFTPRRRRVGDFDLAPDRAVWAAQRMRSADYEAKPSGPARIASRPL